MSGHLYSLLHSRLQLHSIIDIWQTYQKHLTFVAYMQSRGYILQISKMAHVQKFRKASLKRSCCWSIWAKVQELILRGFLCDNRLILCRRPTCRKRWRESKLWDFNMPRHPPSHKKRKQDKERESLKRHWKSDCFATSILVVLVGFMHEKFLRNILMEVVCMQPRYPLIRFPLHWRQI